MEIEYTLSDITKAAQEIWSLYAHKKIWTFDAPMGAGKTTFIKTLCENILQCDDVVSSPTFSVINEYRSKTVGNIFHMDWYRLKDEEEAVNAGVEEVLYSGNLCLAEWPERAPGLLPQDVLQLTFEIIDEHSRKIVIT